MNFQSLKCFQYQTTDENGDKILLPASILEELMNLDVEYPLIFELVTNQKKTHCGVREFTADEGTCYIPQWIMNNLDIKEGDSIYIRNVSLNKATFIKFKPDKFLDLSDPRAVLEYTLRSFSCVTIGDKLHFHYNFKEYILEVTDVKPKKACCIIEADIEVEFEEIDKEKHTDKDKDTDKNKDLSLPIKAFCENDNFNQGEAISAEKPAKSTSTKWGKTSKIAHFQGPGNKL